MRRAGLALAACLLACSGRRCAADASGRGAHEPARADAAPHTRADEGALAAELEEARRAAEVPSIAAGVHGPRGTRAWAVGLADASTARRAGPETPYEAASIAKLVIGLAAVKLASEGRLDLDDDAAAVVGLPLSRDGARVTTRQLLSHTSGLEDDVAALRAGPSPGGLEGYLRAYFSAPSHRAGARGRYRYSNAGAAVAALAVERASGSPRYADYARREILEPIGARSCRFEPSADAAAPHRLEGGAPRPLSRASHAVYPVVDLYCTPGDLVRLGRLLAGRGAVDGVRVVDARAVDEMLRPQAGREGDGEGLGAQLRRIGARAVVGHEGEDEGASTGLYVDLRTGVVAVVLANGDAFASGDATRARAIGALFESLLDAR